MRPSTVKGFSPPLDARFGRPRSPSPSRWPWHSRWRPAPRALAALAAILFSALQAPGLVTAGGTEDPEDPEEPEAPEHPEFSFGVGACAPILERSPGSVFTLELDLTLTTAQNPSPSLGAQGWSMSLAAEGVEIIAITTRGTAGASVLDSPPGLRRPDGFERSAVTTTQGKGSCEPGRGAVTAVVLSQQSPEPVTLPPEGAITVARVTLEGRAPDVPGARTAASIDFVDGCAAGGGPVANAVVWMGQSFDVSRGRCDLEAIATPEVFRRGDPSADGREDISDAILVLACKFLGEQCPGCRDAGDANDDGLMDLSDAVYMLSHLFLGGPPPAPPAGRGACGVDPTPDSLPACEHPGC